MKKGSFRIPGFILFVVIFGIGVWNFLKNFSQKPVSSRINQNPESIEKEASMPSGRLLPMNLPTPKPGFRQYMNPFVRFGFIYPDQIDVDSSENALYVEIDNVIEIYPISKCHTRIDCITRPSDMKTFLLDSVGDCAADGMNISIRCTNLIVDDFYSDTGIYGYKVYRKEEITIDSRLAQSYHYSAYLFFLPPNANTANWTPKDAEALWFRIRPNTPLQKATEGKQILDQISKSFFYF